MQTVKNKTKKTLKKVYIYDVRRFRCNCFLFEGEPGNTSSRPQFIAETQLKSLICELHFCFHVC